MTKRRDFIKMMTATSLLSAAPGALLSSPPSLRKDKKDKIWGCLLHLSFNMWEEYISPHRPFRGFRPDLRLSKPLWDDALKEMANAGVNMVVIDLGDAVSYKSHPEIAVHDAWTTDQLKTELKKIRAMGIEPIPKMNFSAGHDTWLKDYSRMVSTERYYTVCKNLIKEVVELFDKPRYFHLGMDEETASHQSHYLYTVVRKNDAWWKDFYFLVEQTEKSGSKAWIWPDYMLWNEPDQFFKKMPKSVVQSNWYYGESFDDLNNTYVKSYLKLHEHGYEQIPTGSFHAENERSIINTVKFGAQHLKDEHLKGFLQSYWKPTIEEFRERILKGTRLMGEAKKWYTENSGRS